MRSRGTSSGSSSPPTWSPRTWSGPASTTRGRESFTTSLGPVFTNLLLADEINRAPAKVQSALLEVMQEYQVTIAGETHPVPRPFLVLATQNPLESEGTYPLPEAQVDRFMMKVLVGYPNPDEEFVIVERVTGVRRVVNSVATTRTCWLQKECREVFVDPSLIRYAVRLVTATRDPAPRGSGARPLHLLRRHPGAPFSSSRPDAPSPTCGAATTSSPKMSPTWHPTCSGTG
jgi:MoxR-like ATPase